MDIELLSRIQFAMTIGFHYIFPPLSIGLGLLLVVMEGQWLWSRRPELLAMTKFWTRVFGLIFAIGVATGIVMEFEFGTNWAAFSRYVGDVFGSALAAEGLFAFFLESGFLAIVLFGWEKVRPGFHFFSTCMVCLGAHFSAVWIVVANSWQHTPAGYHLVERENGIRAEITDFWEMVFNPSSVDRLIHVILGAYLAAACLVISVSAYYLLKDRFRDAATVALKTALALAAVTSLAQVISGHSSARIVVEHQPAKLAAFEGLFTTQTQAPLHLFGWVDESNQRVFGPYLPAGLSLLAHNDPHAEVTGLDAFTYADRPPVQITFQLFHLMVAIGGLLASMTWLGMLLWWRGSLCDSSSRWGRRYLWMMVFAVVLPQIANQAGWAAAEIGRQPWIVQGLLRTSDGLSQSVTEGHVWFSLIMVGAIYLLLFALFIFLLDHKIRQGPVFEAVPETSAKRYIPASLSEE